jgi:DNA invertase Pin-like site-specific DNA recombinase
MTRAAVYTRISDDAEQRGLGVARQEQDCRELCAHEGWQVVELYVDNDKSAFSGKPRERYNDLLDDVKAGSVDVIVAWHPDRLHRSPKELEHFIDVLEVAQVSVRTVTVGHYDLATSAGRQVARILGAVARAESEHKSERIARKHRQLAEDGVYVGGQMRSFGYTWMRKPDGKRAGLKVVAAERKLIKDAAKRVLAGESLYSIVNRWNAEGVPTVTGAPWSTGVLRQILVSGRVAGWRDRRGEPFSRPQPGSAEEWEAILDEGTWNDVRAILLDPARKRTKVARSYLLGQGQLRCGTCGGKLVASPQKDTAGNSIRRYSCRKVIGGCGKVSAPAEPIEAIVSDAVKDALSDPAFVSRLTGAGDDDEELRRLINGMEKSLAQASKDYYVNKLISRAEFLTARDLLVPELDAMKATLAATTRRRPVPLLAGLDDLRAKWDGLGLDRQQALINLCIESVTILSANRRPDRHFDARRVRPPVWRV